MKYLRRFVCLSLAAGIIVTFGAQALQSAPAAEGGDLISLSDGWRIHSSAEINADGPAISSAAMDASAWHPAMVPSTVLSALVKDGTYKDIFFGKNLENVPVESLQESLVVPQGVRIDRGAGRRMRGIDIRGHQLSGRCMAQRPARGLQRMRFWALFASFAWTLPAGLSPAKTSWPSRSFRPGPVISPWDLWTGIRRLPTGIWVCSAR